MPALHLQADVGKLVGLTTTHLGGMWFQTAGAPHRHYPFIGQCTAEWRRGSPGFGSSSPERLVYFGLHVEAGGQVALAEFAKHRQLVP